MRARHLRSHGTGLVLRGRMTRFRLLVLGTVAAGCGTYATAYPLNEPPRPLAAREPGSVEVYSSGPPARPHVDVALLEVKQYDRFDGGTPEILANLVMKAAEMGCDGVVIGGQRERDGAPTGSSWALIDPGDRTMHATCIVYSGPAPAAVPAPAPTAAPAEGKISLVPPR
jgi:hypothetical protein